MRKLSVAPLFILIVMFLWTRFASAATELATELPTEVPTELPSKLPAKTKKMSVKKNVYVVPPKTDVVVLIPKRKVSKKKFVAVDTAPGLPKTLPAKTKVIVDFDRHALPLAPPIVIREDETSLPEAMAASNNEVQSIRRHEISEAPVLDFVGPEQRPIEITNATPRQLRQALPDSDSFEVPASAKRAPQQPMVIVQAQAPAAVVVAAAVPAPAPVIIEMPTAGIAPATPLPQWTPVPDERATISSTTSAPQLIAPPVVLAAAQPTLPPELIGPPAPPVIDTVSQRTDVSVTEVAIDNEKASREIHSESAVKTTLLAPQDEIAHHRIFIRGGYLDAAYSKLESDLKNGATMFGFSVSQVFEKTEVRLGFDVAHGLDQSISLRNTRMAMFRAEGLYTLWGAGDFMDLYFGGAVGIADIDVTSFRGQSSSGDTTVRENAKGDALLASPELGTRFKIGRTVSLDLTAQYLVLFGAAPLSNLGGLLTEAALGFRF